MLTGNVVREGDDLRITPQLIDVATNRILWKGTIDLKYDNLLAVQDNVAREIVKGLALNLTPSQSERLTANAPSNALAYEYYLRGVDLYARNEFPMAIKMLEKSVELDPNYARLGRKSEERTPRKPPLQFGGREQYTARPRLPMRRRCHLSRHNWKPASIWRTCSPIPDAWSRLCHCYAKP